MSNVALYTFGLLDPAAGPTRMADFVKRAGEVFCASDHAPGFLGRAMKAEPGSTAHTGEDFGRWGFYALPLGLPDFAGHDPKIHIATLSLWRDTDSARQFVYRGHHRDALKVRHDWFLKGPWPGYVLWNVEEGVMPSWSDGTSRLRPSAETARRPIISPSARGRATCDHLDGSHSQNTLSLFRIQIPTERATACRLLRPIAALRADWTLPTLSGYSGGNPARPFEKPTTFRESSREFTPVVSAVQIRLGFVCRLERFCCRQVHAIASRSHVGHGAYSYLANRLLYHTKRALSKTIYS